MKEHVLAGQIESVLDATDGIKAFREGFFDFMGRYRLLHGWHGNTFSVSVSESSLRFEVDVKSRVPQGLTWLYDAKEGRGYYRADYRAKR